MKMRKGLVGLMVFLAQTALAAQVVYVDSHSFKDSSVKWEESPSFVICSECPSPSDLKLSGLTKLLMHVKSIPSVSPAPAPSAPVPSAPLGDGGELKAYFCFDRYELLKPERERIAEFVKPRLKDFGFELYGYACPIGSERYNLKLSWRRAQEAASFVRELGGEVFRVEGKGEAVFDPHRLEESRCVVIKAKKKGGMHGEAE